MNGRRKIVAAAAVALAALPAAAQAYWTARSAAGGAGQARAATLPQANAPAVSAVGPDVTVRWTPTSFTPTLGYDVYRHASSGGSPSGPAIAVPCTPVPGAGGTLVCSDPAVGPGVYQYTVATTLANWVGPESTPSAPLTVYNDTTAPTTTASTSPAAPASGWYAGPVDVTLAAADNLGGSGVALIRYTLDGSDPRSSATAVDYTSPITVSQTTTVTFAARDNANIWETPGTQLVQIDTQPPTNSLTLQVVTGMAVLSGNTVFYSGATKGEFTLTNAVADTGGSGPASSATAALGGSSAGWSHTPGTVSAPAGGPYVSAGFSWARGTTSAPTEIVTAADGAGNVAPTPPLTFSEDSSPPTTSASFSPAPNAAGWNDGPVTVTLSASDNAGGSGVDRISYTIDGSDPTSSGSAQSYSGPLALSSSATLRFAAVDAIGNWEPAQTRAVQIDPTAPTPALALSNVTGNAFASGATIFYRGAAAGSFTLTNTVSDGGGSGAASSATAALAGAAAGWSHSPSTVSAPAGGPFVSNPFAWLAGTTSSPTETVTTADVAGNATPLTLSLIDDSTGPTGAASFPVAAAYASGSSWNAGCATAAAGDICGTATDAGSGLAQVTLVLTRTSDGRCWEPARGRFQPAACSGVAPDTFTPGATPAWTLGFPCATGGYTLDVTLRDNVGNVAALPQSAWRISSCVG